MNNKGLQDERVLLQRRQINSDAYGLLVIVLLCSILVQEFLLNATFEQYAAELICFLGVSVYVLVRYITLGLNLYGEGHWATKNPLVRSLITGVIVAIVNGFYNYSKYAEHYRDTSIWYFIATLGITFVCSAGSVYILTLLVDYLSKQKQAKIQQQLDEDEQNE